MLQQKNKSFVIPAHPPLVIEMEIRLWHCTPLSQHWNKPPVFCPGALSALVFPLVIISQPENSSCCQRPCRVCHCRQQGGTRWTVAQVDHIPGPCLSLSGCLSIYLPLSACLPACGELAAEKRGLFSEQGAVGDKGGQQEDRKRRGCFQKDNDKEEVVQHKSFGT